jgi:hypothetical protein
MANVIIEKVGGAFKGVSDSPEVTQILVAKADGPWEVIDLEFAPTLVEMILAERASEEQANGIR